MKKLLLPFILFFSVTAAAQIPIPKRFGLTNPAKNYHNFQMQHLGERQSYCLLD
jgi:hypothetical protein